MVALPPSGIHLGLGLTSLGRVWGISQRSPPTCKEAEIFLEQAVAMGTRIFDTAPAYGTSERRLGKFLLKLPAAEFERLTIMTKAGEHWDSERETPYTDHSYSALCASIDRSLDLLGRIDVLQIHQATAAVLGESDVYRAIDYARSLGIVGFGASVKSIDAGIKAIESGFYSSLQFPLNKISQRLEPLVRKCQDQGLTIVINRPFATGALVNPSLHPDAGLEVSAAFIFFRDIIARGIILSGTTNAVHLAANLSSFQRTFVT